MAFIFALFYSGILAILSFIVYLCEGKLGNTSHVLRELVAESRGGRKVSTNSYNKNKLNMYLMGKRIVPLSDSIGTNGFVRMAALHKVRVLSQTKKTDDERTYDWDLDTEFYSCHRTVLQTHPQIVGRLQMKLVRHRRL